MADNSGRNIPVIAGALFGSIAIANYIYLKSKASESTTPCENVIIGDVGGTNVRLQLKRIYHQPNSPQNTTLKELTVYKSQQYPSFMACVTDFLKDVPATCYPRFGVVGIAGAVTDNTTKPVNIPHWPVSDGYAVAETCKLDEFVFINDFLAASYGVSRLEHRDATLLGDFSHLNISDEGSHSVKVVVGPGTGLGHGILVKNKESGMYHPYPSEGGHVDYAIQTSDDWDLACFAKKFIEESNNVENLRAKGKVDRVSVERLCAGPAVPLIYAFMKEKYPDLKVVLENDTDYGPAKNFDDIEAKDIISMGMQHRDPLCMKVVEKFTEVLGAATGNFALMTLPYGGIYIMGGVSRGIKDYLLTTNTFMNAFSAKGRCSNLMKHFRVLLVDPEIELGLVGAEEKARRMILEKAK